MRLTSGLGPSFCYPPFLKFARRLLEVERPRNCTISCRSESSNISLVVLEYRIFERLAISGYTVEYLNGLPYPDIYNTDIEYLNGLPYPDIEYLNGLPYPDIYNMDIEYLNGLPYPLPGIQKRPDIRPDE